MLKRVVLDEFVWVVLVSVFPEEPCGRTIASVLPHIGGKHLQPGMSAGDPRSALECLSGSDVVLALHVLNEAQMKIKVPIVGELLDAPLHQIDGEIGAASARGRL